MANNPQPASRVEPEPIDAFRVRKENAIAIPGEMVTYFQAHPSPTAGKPWVIEWHKLGLRVSRVDLARHGAWIIPWANITEINVSRPTTEGK